MDLKLDIRKQLQAFQKGDLRDNALALLNTLGYISEKTMELDGSPAAFLGQFNQRPDATRFSEEKARSKDWKEIQLLFQLTDQELSGQVDLFQDNAVAPSLMSSYLFFAVQLSGKDYARGKLADITRQINRLFPMPVMVLFVYDEKLSIAVINRRRNKRDDSKDVLGKVTLIQNISLENPHRGHLDILSSFALPELAGKTGIHSFDALHAAWEEIFNVELLNKKFYRELSNWYFWAMQHVHFPFDILEYEQNELDKGDLFKDKEKLREHDAKNLIRLLTRLLFVWFIKEKGLIPEPLFLKEELEKDWLNDFDAKSKDTRYYKAILQNLFFASLNQPVEKREFRKDGRQHRNITNLMRYKSHFQDSDAFVELMKSIVPFMNGGLFECLDKPHPTLKGRQGGDVILYEDGFSDRKDSVLKVPDFLFFGDEQVIDLSDVYGDKKRKKEKVCGIIPILNSYKFTIVENTPIEQEIALDPELLGKVFENLLASYNPETKTTARKQTGSFYTPRTIVDYMVDESLKAYLKKSLTSVDPLNAKAQGAQSSAELCEPLSSSRLCVGNSLMSEADAEAGLEILFAYTEKEHAFTDAEKHALIKAIDGCKILDPACGSGAFPMGILHKLEFILGKLDPNNKLWRDRQIEKVDATIAAAEKIDDTTIRENTIVELESQKQDVEEAFSNNELGYGRKLYLIENCIYGVDIQSIATQVSRLRFFISLIVDQKVNAGKDNFGIRPLPNLEAKFATADTLIQIEKPKDQLNLFDSKEVQALEKELKKVRHEMFGAKTPKTKTAKRKRDKELREEIAGELKANGWSNASARQLAGWDPYDQNATSSFFDSEWMFDLKGFDIVIGNPPYVFGGNTGISKQNKEIFKKLYVSGAGKINLFTIFIERGAQLLSEGGIVSYILPNTLLRVTSYKATRKLILENLKVEEILDLDVGVFDKVTASTIAIRLSNQKAKPSWSALIKHGLEDIAEKRIKQSSWVASDGVIDIFSSQEDRELIQRIESAGDPLGQYSHRLRFGVVISGNFEEVVGVAQQNSSWKPFLEGDEIAPYKVNYGGRFLHYSKPLLHRSRTPDIFECRKIMIQRITGGHRPLKATLDEQNYYNKESILNLILEPEYEHMYEYILGVVNSSIANWFYKKRFTNASKLTVNLSKEYVGKIPVKRPTDSEAALFEKLVAMVQLAKREGLDVPASFLEELIDACVLELYFPEEAATKDLQFMDQVSALLGRMASPPSVTDIDTFVAIANDPKHPIRNQLIRLIADSPDLFAVIKQEGEV